MFEYFIGYVTEIHSDYIVLEVGLIGYALRVANPQAYRVDKQHRVKVYIYQAVTDSNQTLYGFKTRVDKIIFQKLINVSGIGPKNAIVILSSNNHQALLEAINQGNVTYLTRFPGVGKKTAKQIVLDLQGKLNNLIGPGSGTQQLNSVKISPHLSDALDALEALGFRHQDVESVESQLVQEKNLSTNQYISRGLKLLNRFL